MFGGRDADQRLPWRDDAGTVRADDPGLVALLHVVGPRICAVLHGDSLGDHHKQRDLGVDGLDDRVLGELRRHEDDRHVGAGLLHGLHDGAEHRKLDVLAVLIDVRHRGPGLARVDAAQDLGAGLEHPCGVRGGLTAGDALHNDLAVLRQKDCHVSPFRPLLRRPWRLQRRRLRPSCPLRSPTGGWPRRGCGGPRRRCCRRAGRPAACWPRRRGSSAR